MIRSSGASSKWAGEGGSFGIGKNAPFAASRMRTVIYSTVTKDRGVAFQGVARLVSHEHAKGGTAQHVGYLGDKKGASIRDKKLIPSSFGRSKPGTDVIILGYNAEDTWKDDLIASVLEYFWPAIHLGDLEVEVAGTKITRTNLSKLLGEYSTKGELTAHHYYRAFTDKAATQFEEKLSTLGKVSVHLLAGEGLPKKVAMVRKTGMVIYHQSFRALVPFCGVFFCRNKHGNEILRDMEPPRHDAWDQNHPEKNAHRKDALEFMTYIRDCIGKLAPADNETVLNIPDLSQYLPDDDESADEGFEGQPEEELSKKESFDRRPEVKPVTARKLDRSRRHMQPDESKADNGDLDTEEAGSNDGTAGGSESGANNGDGGTGSGGGGKGPARAAPNQGSEHGHNAKPAIPIRSRVYAKDLAQGTYMVIAELIKPAKTEVFLLLKAVADDATASAVALDSAKLSGGGVLETPQPGVIGPVKFTGKGRLLIEVKLVEPRKLAMEVVAHEAE